jgi:hypothetical protein
MFYDMISSFGVRDYILLAKEFGCSFPVPPTIPSLSLKTDSVII